VGYKPSDAYYKEIITSSPTTGAAQDADSTPVATANRNGTDDGSFTLTVTHLDTGRYKVTGTIPSGYARGDVINVTVAATVGGVAAKGVVDTQILDSKRVGDLNDVTAATVAAAVLTDTTDVNAVGSLGYLATHAPSWYTAAPSTTAIASAVLQDTQSSDFAVVGSFGHLIVTMLDTNVGSRAPASTALSTATWTSTRAGYLDNLGGGAVALAATALSTANWTNARAGYLDNLSAGPVAQAATALSTAQWTNARAAKLDNLDAAVSTRSTYAGGAVAGITGVTFPANFASLAITSGGAVTVGTNGDKTGYSLAASGLDAITIEAGVNIRQACCVIAAFAAGVVSGAGTTSITFKGANSSTTRIQFTNVDAFGNRPNVALTLP
jgi:hypothetical protein